MQIFSYLALVLTVPLLDLGYDICGTGFIKKGEHGADRNVGTIVSN
jgi:hypothetical protein